MRGARGGERAAGCNGCVAAILVRVRRSFGRVDEKIMNVRGRTEDRDAEESQLDLNFRLSIGTGPFLCDAALENGAKKPF